MSGKLDHNVHDNSDDAWIEGAVEEYRRHLIEFKKEMSSAADGTLLDVADEQIIKNFEPMLKKLQQEIIQKHINKRQKDGDYRRCPTCKKK
jgi:hypothetical protein